MDQVNTPLLVVARLGEVQLLMQQHEDVHVQATKLVRTGLGA